jgi:predicted metal-dependent hydrolase
MRFPAQGFRRGRQLAYPDGVPLDWQTGELAEGLGCYRRGEFWAAHEHWESVWLQLQEPEKSFLRALIQTAAAFHHVKTGNTRGAVSLLAKALRRIESCPETFAGIDVARLRVESGAWMQALESEAEARPTAFSRIVPLNYGSGARMRATRS